MIKTNFEAERNRLVDGLVEWGVIRNKDVIRAMRTVPREEFIPENMRSKAYIDTPLPIHHGQTISAPHMVAMMCEFLELQVGDKVLEVGAGSGYHAAIIAEIVAPKNTKTQGHVYTTEIVKELAEFAGKNLAKTNYDRHVTVIHHDGSLGLPEYAPFDKILITATAPRVPPPLIEQLKPGGILLTPLGDPHSYQVLRLLKKKIDGYVEVSDLCGVAFVPLRGKYGWGDMYF